MPAMARRWAGAGTTARRRGHNGVPRRWRPAPTGTDGTDCTDCHLQNLNPKA